MRFSTTAVLALPLLASAAESPFEQYKAKFQNFLSSFGSATVAGTEKAADAAADAAGAASSAATKAASKATAKVVDPLPIETVTLENWKDTFYAPVKAESAEWLVLVSGRNKTCFGKCGQLEDAFTESALKLAALPQTPSPHLAYVNCDDQPVLCNSWSANAGGLWLWDVPPAPGPVDIYTHKLNLTTVSTQDVVDAYSAYVSAANKTEAGWRRFDQEGFFHPTEGKLAKLGVSVPLGYFFWALNAIPSWAMMLLISFVSRTMMNRRMSPTNGRAGAAGAAGAAPRAAPPGDARS
ncbi:hypothetical protein N0V88_000587 [Collariella sp. IMI 366227]|nr:hypothetical protein N0V88_000587 [Collariella sp. IMI 366227]